MNTFEDWLEFGIAQGWCGPSVCDTHDGTPMAESELEEFEEGGDPCVHVIRLYEDLETKLSVEANHAPSIWRATNRGIDV
jgi:hypothetical protein